MGIFNSLDGCVSEESSESGLKSFLSFKIGKGKEWKKHVSNTGPGGKVKRGKKLAMKTLPSILSSTKRCEGEKE